MKISAARAAAFEILRRIETERAYSSVLLPLYEDALSDPDRGLCHELVLGTLRRQLYLDRVVEAFAGSKKLDIEVRIALRLGIYQIYFLDRIPPYSAINESVNLVQAARKKSAKGFVNAILRKVSRVRPDIAFSDSVERISVETSHPRWLVEKWITDMGIDEAEATATVNNNTPETAFRVLGGISDRGREFIGSCDTSKISPDCYIAKGSGGEINRMATRGEIYIQDAASQMVARSIDIPANGKFLDVCASPGGKAGLVGLINPQATLIAAGDIHDLRIRFLRDSVKIQGAEIVKIVQYDAQQGLPFVERSFDTVLVDAPCSGTGTIRRNPEIRYHLMPQDLVDLFNKQLSILSNASKLVKVGGTLVYSTCSFEREENENVASAFIRGTLDFEPKPPDVPAKLITDDGFARTLPSRDGVDGFFVATFCRKV